MDDNITYNLNSIKSLKGQGKKMANKDNKKNRKGKEKKSTVSKNDNKEKKPVKLSENRVPNIEEEPIVKSEKRVDRKIVPPLIPETVIEPEQPTIETVNVSEIKEEQKAPEEEKKEPSKKEEKNLVIIYCCEHDEGEMSAFASTKEIVRHLETRHGIIVATTNDLLGNMKRVPKKQAQQMIADTKKAQKTFEVEEKASQARIEAKLGVTPEQEPKMIVNPSTVKDAEDVYQKAIGKLGRKEGEQDPTFFAEEMNEDYISFACEVTMANNQETMGALAEFKKIVFKYKI